MANLNSAQVRDGVVFSQGPAGVECVAMGDVTVSANPSVGDSWFFTTIKAGAIITQIQMYMSDMDTNGTPTLAGSIGFSDTAGTTSDAGYLAAAVYGSGANVFGGGRLLTSGQLVLPADTTIYFKVTAVAATFAAGKVFCCVRYTYPITTTHKTTT